MELYTKCTWPDWDRIVDVVVADGKISGNYIRYTIY